MKSDCQFSVRYLLAIAGLGGLLYGVDVWEHAYYLDWQNQRAAYAKAVVEKHLDWSAASRRFAAD